MKTKILIVIAIIFLAISCAEEKKQTKKEETTSLDSVPRSKIEIIGAGPYSLDGNKENYKFHLLTSFSYATYELDPKTGNYKTILEWPTTPVIDSAKQQNAKTFLTLNNFGEKNNGLFLTNQKAQDASIKIL